MVVETEDSDMRSGDEAAAVATTQQLLVVGVGADRRVAIPLAEVTRLEKLPADVVEVVGGREVVQYRGAITPLVRLPHVLGTYADTDGELTVIVATRGPRSVAIAVTEIVDIVEDDGSRHSDVAGDVLVGSAVLKDRVTELLDVRAVVRSADPHFFDIDDLSAADAVADLVGV
jgi:two-component system chemotaxis sensor kinase CheA